MYFEWRWVLLVSPSPSSSIKYIRCHFVSRSWCWKLVIVYVIPLSSILKFGSLVNMLFRLYSSYYILLNLYRDCLADLSVLFATENQYLYSGNTFACTIRCRMIILNPLLSLLIWTDIAIWSKKIIVKDLFKTWEMYGHYISVLDKFRMADFIENSQRWPIRFQDLL